MFEIPSVPDAVPQFISGLHLTPEKQRGAQTMVRCRSGERFLVSSVQLPDGTFETRVFPNAGKGPAWRELDRRTTLLGNGEDYHSELCTRLHAWPGPASGQPFPMVG